MTPALIWDCSAAIAMAFEDERDDYTRRALRAVHRQGALVPAHWTMEIVNVLRVAERRKRIDPAASKGFLTLLTTLPIQVEDCSSATKDMAELYETAARFMLTSYDAAYITLARESGFPLASKDKALRTYPAIKREHLLPLTTMLLRCRSAPMSRIALSRTPSIMAIRNKICFTFDNGIGS